MFIPKKLLQQIAATLSTKNCVQNSRHIDDMYEKWAATKKSKPPHTKPKAACKNKNTFDLWYDFKNYQLKKPEAHSLQKKRRFSSFPKPTATKIVEILNLKAVTNCVCKNCLN